jgi:TonB-linked SusC/RagA family outer membrane protein
MRLPRTLLLAVLWTALPVALHAQAQTTIAGRVRTPGGTPIADAQIIAVGQQRVARSDASGAYRLLVNGAPGTVIAIRATKLGHQMQLARVTLEGALITRDFTMAEQPAALNAVVVTGSPTGIATRREVANVVAQLPVAELIDRVPSIANITYALQSRVPGVQVLTQSGTEGTAARIRIRGVSSVSAGSAPIYVIDGIRMSGGAQTGFGLSGATQSASDAIHPQDIESFEVIKGPAAATLYGADAANGVIAITTKRGTPGEQGAKITARTSYGNQEWSGRSNTNYTLCTQARIDSSGLGIVARSYPGCAGKTAGTLISADLLRSDPGALRTGHTRLQHLDVTGGGERFGYYLGGNYDDNDGVVFNNTFKRYSGRSNFTVAPSDKFGADINIGYYRTDVRLPLSDNASNGLTRNANRAIPGRLNNFGVGWLGLSPNEINAFDDQTRSDRFLFSGTVRSTPVSWFSQKLSGGFDYGTRKNEEFYPIDTTGKAPYGAVNATGGVFQFKPVQKLYTIDYAATISNKFGSTLTSEFSVGSQLISSRTESLQGNGDGLSSNTVRLISLASNRTAFEGKVEQSTLGFLAQEKIGWNDRLYVTLGLRADDNSAFGKEYNLVAYPKFGASYVISEESFFKVPHVDQLRLRTAWGRAGNSPVPYAADRTFVVQQLVNADATTRPALTPSNFGNPNLFAERGEELEFGFDGSLFSGRITTDFTFYNKTTKDAFIPVPAAPSSGFVGNVLQNVGTINNKGIEATVTVVPIDRPNFDWESRVAFATLKNRFVSFGGVRESPLQFGFVVAGIGLQVAPGTELPQFYGTVPSRDASGNLLRTATGALIVDRDTVTFGGSLPTRTLSWDNNVRIFKNLRMGMQLDHQGGHYQFNLTKRTRVFDLIDRAVVDPAADTLQRRILLSGAGAQFIEKADFVKLREVSLNYTIPQRLLGNMRMNEVVLSVSGRNLKTWTDYTGSDPEVNADNSDFLLAETNAIPPARRYTVSLTVRF